MPVFNNILAGAAGQTGGAAAAGPIKSVRFNNDDSAYLNRSATDSGSNVYKYTVSWWMKIGSIGTDKTIVSFATNNAVNGWTKIHLRTDNRLSIFGDSTGTALSIRPTMLFRDPNAWYHCVVSLDTTQSTYSDQAKFYVNGVQQTDYTGTLAFAQNTALSIGEATTHHVGTEPNSLGSLRNYFDGYIADLHVIEGQVKEATDFGAFDDNGVWQAAAYTGTYGTNGFHLFDFANESGIGDDSSGNDNDFTVNNISSTAGAGNDVLFDVPTNGTQSDTGAGGEVSGNYCTMNPLDKSPAYSLPTFSNGNLDVACTTYDFLAWATIQPSSGKWYYEHTVTDDGGSTAYTSQNRSIVFGDYTNKNTLAVAWRRNAATAGLTGSPTFDTYATGDVLGVAIDLDNNQAKFFKNGVAQGNGGFYTFTNSNVGNPLIIGWFGKDGLEGSFNFGQRPFAYTAPSGFKALCTTNLPDPTIADGSEYFDAKLYDGTGAAQTVSGLSFSPDLAWLKRRSSTESNTLFDTVRGAGKELISDSTSAEYDAGTGSSGSLIAFNSDGFDLGTRSSVNGSSTTNVAWAWDAGSSTVSNTDGSITASVRANQTAGFSIVTYTGNSTSGATVGHGLSAAPALIFLKSRGGARNWVVYSSSLTSAAYYLSLNKTIAQTSLSTVWNSTAPTSTVFSIGNDLAVNNSSENYVAYCFTPVAGYSSFGSYVGNGSNDGVFVHTGFSVKWLLTKASSHGSDWQLWDSARQSYNVNANTLTPNSNGAETGTAGYAVDFLSNGFKFRNYGSSSNQSGYTYIWAAFAENPFQANGGLAR